MKNPVKFLDIGLGTLFFAGALLPVSSSAQNLYFNHFNSDEEADGLGAYQHYLDTSMLEGIKSELIADRTMEVKFFSPEMGSTKTATGHWLNTDYLSFAYENSAGPLTFSTGYVYMAAIDENLGLDDLAALGYREYKTMGSSPDWYLAVDLSNSILLSNEVKMGFDAQISYLVDVFGEQDKKKVSMYLNLPFTISNRVTIAPEFQYSFDLNKDPIDTAKNSTDTTDKTGDKRDFYGGVSISFAY